MSRRRLRGFTLVELLVVITIIGMLMALLLPAVTASIEQARQAGCKQKLSQLSKAVTSTESRTNRYPGYRQSINGQLLSWVVVILPDLDRIDVYRDWTEAPPPPSTATTPKRTAVYLEFMVCDSDPPEKKEKDVTSYVCNAGLTDKTGVLAAEKHNPANGVFGDRTETTFPHFTNYEFISQGDGLSNTLMLSENIQATFWGAVISGSSVPSKTEGVFVWHNLGTATKPTIEEQKINGNKTTASLTVDSARPSSFHAGGVNAVFCDTHTIFLREDIDYRVYVQLMTSRNQASNAPQATKHYILSVSDYQ
jgi:prepilin-type N-terminal cleavage/methylation domain-containing protein/prepilin-type processing-associated H-X9-DG protein